MLKHNLHPGRNDRSPRLWGAGLCTALISSVQRRIKPLSPAHLCIAPLCPLLCLPLLSGCATQTVEAKFRLGDGPILIFIDDIGERVDWPPAKRYLWEDLSQELLRTKSATRVIPSETLESLRRTMPDFQKRGAREIGEAAGADQVLWIETQDFLAEEQITDAQNAAYWSVTVKVLNAREKENRSKVRLWPESPEGHFVSASMTGASVMREKSKDAITRVLSAKLAVEISRLFHKHEIDVYEAGRNKALQ